MSLDLDQAGKLSREDVEELEQVAAGWSLARRILRALRDLRAERDALLAAAGMASATVDDVCRAIEAVWHVVDHGERAALVALEEERDAALARADHAQEQADRLREQCEEARLRAEAAEAERDKLRRRDEAAAAYRWYGVWIDVIDDGGERLYRRDDRITRYEDIDALLEEIDREEGER